MFSMEFHEVASENQQFWRRMREKQLECTLPVGSLVGGYSHRYALGETDKSVLITVEVIPDLISHSQLKHFCSLIMLIGCCNH